MAIAFVASGQNEGAAITTLNITVNCTGADFLVGYIYLAAGTADDLTAATYNGVAMTFVQKGSKPASTEKMYQYYLRNPASGSNTLQFTRGSAGFMLGFGACYSGTNTTTQNAHNGTQSVTATSVTTSVTTTVNNSWMSVCGFYDSDPAPAAGTNSTQRGTTLLIGPMALYDNNTAITPAGVYSMTQTCLSSGIITLGMDIEPAGGGAGYIPRLLTLKVG